jgi:hypothetical protein
MVGSVLLYIPPIAHRLLGLFWGAAVQKVPHVRCVIHAGFLSANLLYVGRVGSSHVGISPHAFHALLDMG